MTPRTRPLVHASARTARVTIGALLLALAVSVLSAATGAPTASAATGAPVTPAFGPVIEPFAAYDGAKTCLPKVTQPGVAKLEALLTATYGKTSFGTWRACSGAVATSEHNEGRALDFMLDSSKASDVAIANAFGVWLFATDAAGNPYANARRLGIMYIIWHGRMWRSYDVAAGWQPYTGAENHYDHMHISFSWAGALAQSSFWNIAASYPLGPPLPSDARPQDFAAGTHVVDGKQWSTSCAIYGTAGGRRCITSVYDSTITTYGHGWVVVNAWIRDSVNYLDTDSAAWSTSLVGVPGTQVWNGAPYATTCTPSAGTGARECVTQVQTQVVSQVGSTFQLTTEWLPYAHVWLAAAPTA